MNHAYSATATAVTFNFIIEYILSDALEVRGWTFCHLCNQKTTLLTVTLGHGKITTDWFLVEKEYAQYKNYTKLQRANNGTFGTQCIIRC